MLIIPGNAADMNVQAGVIRTSSGNLNVRSSASSGSAVVSSLKKDSYVTLMEKNGSWWKVEYAPGKYGYCHADYIRTADGTPAKVNTSSGSLNVRTGPGTGYSKLGSVNKGEVVIVLSNSDGWSKVLYQGTKTGYVSASYLSAGYPAVSLWVRDMKQMDLRWADTIVAESGKTFSKIGCATTAIAMLEAHRTGVTVYPDEMMTKLKYTPSGSVFWPEHYTTVTDGNSYLTAIYKLLRQGKPILFGATNPYGKQHWVVITGYIGGNTLSSSGFMIRDPGSYLRTTLDQFLKDYPNFYKYFHY